MSYNIKFDDITSVQVETQKTMNAWGESMSSLNKAMNDFIKNQNLQGQAISSMRTYLVEVHGTLLQTLANLMNDYSTNLLLYKDGYYQIDSFLHTKLPGKEFTRLHSDLKGSRDKLKPEIELLKTTKSDISDLVSYEGSSHTSTIMNYNFLMNQIKNLDTSITQYESSHSSQDLAAFKELLAATKALIAEHSGKSRNVGTYQSGDFGKLKSVQRFALAYDQAAKQMESRVERVKAAQERDKVRFEALARSDKGWGDMAIGAISIIVGVTAIVFTWGTATPLVVATAITAGVGSTAYGVSNMYEASQDIKLGNAGDIQTKAENPIRDTAFMGNDKLHHEVGNVFVTASAIMIPIGKTQSVVQGLTEFAIGEAGAYTAGQTAYYGTKLAGGSEEDAQTANFLGNLIGGYTASSAANKFSLNKVKVDVEVPKYSTQELDAYFRKSQQSFTNAEAEGVRVYTSNDYTYINNYLRGFSDDLGPVSTSTISDIDSALSKMELPADLTLYRGTDSAPFMNIVDKNFNGTLDWNSLVGKTFEDRAFVSTSVDTPFDNEVRWVINAPKGSKGGMVTAFSMFPNENELLLPRNSKFLIKGIDKVDNKIILKMDLIE